MERVKVLAGVGGVEFVVCSVVVEVGIIVGIVGADEWVVVEVYVGVM